MTTSVSKQIASHLNAARQYVTGWSKPKTTVTPTAFMQADDAFLAAAHLAYVHDTDTNTETPLLPDVLARWERLAETYEQYISATTPLRMDGM